MLTGVDWPEEDVESDGRNLQFELYVSGLLRIGGVAADVNEPDVLIKYGAVVGLGLHPMA
jgi:hypothetical protein